MTAVLEAEATTEATPNDYVAPGEEPVTSVFHTNNLEYIHETVDCRSDDPDYHAAREEAEADEDFDEESFGECYEQSTAFIGMRQGEDGKWEPDKESDLGYAAIVRMGSCCAEYVTQVIWSKWGIRCYHCSPCYPNQGDAEMPGTLLAYSVPPDVVGDDYDALTGNKEKGDRSELKERIFLLPA